MFSMIAGQFLNMLTSYHTLHEIYEDSEQLGLFIGVLKHFNRHKDIEIEFEH